MEISQQEDASKWEKAEKRLLEDSAYEMSESEPMSTEKAENLAKHELEDLKNNDKDAYNLKVKIAHILNELDQELGKRSVALKLIDIYSSEYSEVSKRIQKNIKNALIEGNNIEKPTSEQLNSRIHQITINRLRTHKPFENLSDTVVDLLGERNRLTFRLEQHQKG